MNNKETLNLLEEAVEYIEELSQKTITHIVGWNIDKNKINIFYENSELKKKADDHGTTELLTEMFFKYLADKKFNSKENIELHFDIK